MSRYTRLNRQGARMKPLALISLIAALGTAPALAQPLMFTNKGQQTLTGDKTEKGRYYPYTYNTQDLFPVVVPTGQQIAHVSSDQFRWRGGNVCTGLDARIHLAEAIPWAGQTIYRINDRHGLLIWIGDPNRPLNPAQGTQWQRIFDEICTGQTRGYKIVVQPVVLQRPTLISGDWPFTPPRIKLATVRLRENGTRRLRGNFEFDVYLDITFAVRPKTVSCKVQVPPLVNLQAVRRQAFDQQDEIMAGNFSVTLGCGQTLPSGFVLTDIISPTNRGMQLGTTGTAKGVALALRTTQGQPLRLGLDLPRAAEANQRRVTNPWNTRSPSANYAVSYVKTGAVQAGTVIGAVKFDVFYP